jgi:hypothetical protein
VFYASCCICPMENRPRQPIGKMKARCSGETRMLETIAIILIVLWLLGLVSSATMGGFIHVLLVLAIILIVLRVIRG